MKTLHAHDVAICVCAHNEETTIGVLLTSMMSCEQVRLGAWPIMVMASGCTDGTIREATSVAQRFPGASVNITVEQERSGKVFSVNRFVRSSNADILIFADADVSVAVGSLDALVATVRRDRSVGIAVPLRKSLTPASRFWGFCETVQATVHNEAEPPKVGRLYAIRRELAHVDEQATADDTFQEWACLAAGSRIVRVADASLANQGPENIRDYIGLRRRVIVLHLNLCRRTRYRPATMRRWEMLGLCWRHRKHHHVPWMIALAGLEAASLILAYWDVRVRGKEYVRWPIISSTKASPSNASSIANEGVGAR